MFLAGIAVLAMGAIPACSSDSTGSTGTVSQITFAPGPFEVPVGEMVRVLATARDESGAEIDHVTLVWTSSDEEVAKVDDIGRVTGVGPGTATITASFGTITQSTDVTVTGGDEAESAIP
jgi:uncharacterized protein YjdB